jgi:hypothetical protein
VPNSRRHKRRGVAWRSAERLDNDLDIADRVPALRFLRFILKDSAPVILVPTRFRMGARLVPLLALAQLSQGSIEQFLVDAPSAPQLFQLR